MHFTKYSIRKRAYTQYLVLKMICPYCQNRITKVLDKRDSDFLKNKTRRRKKIFMGDYELPFDYCISCHVLYWSNWELCAWQNGLLNFRHPYHFSEKVML